MKEVEGPNNLIVLVVVVVVVVLMIIIIKTLIQCLLFPRPWFEEHNHINSFNIQTPPLNRYYYLFQFLDDVMEHREGK